MNGAAGTRKLKINNFPAHPSFRYDEFSQKDGLVESESPSPDGVTQRTPCLPNFTNPNPSKLEPSRNFKPSNLALHVGHPNRETCWRYDPELKSMYSHKQVPNPTTKLVETILSPANKLNFNSPNDSAHFNSQISNIQKSGTRFFLVH